MNLLRFHEEPIVKRYQGKGNERDFLFLRCLLDGRHTPTERAHTPRTPRWERGKQIHRRAITTGKVFVTAVRRIPREEQTANGKDTTQQTVQEEISRRNIANTIFARSTLLAPSAFHSVATGNFDEEAWNAYNIYTRKRRLARFIHCTPDLIH